MYVYMYIYIYIYIYIYVCEHQSLSISYLSCASSVRVSFHGARDKYSLSLGVSGLVKPARAVFAAEISLALLGSVWFSDVRPRLLKSVRENLADRGDRF
jgi:hypothetical protein